MAIRVIAASYHSERRGSDVTAICQAFVNGNNDDIPVNNDTMGGDPDQGEAKTFEIVYELENGQILGRHCLEGQEVDLAPHGT